jgi:hypothetical protein
MKAIEFVTAIRERVIENDYSIYQDLLEDTIKSDDPVWKEILPLYNNINNEQRKSFLNFIRLIQTNTVSHILGILDGSTYLDEKRQSFILKTEQEEDIINGDLQDIFLEMEEG